jgi:aconitate hydratase
LSQAKKAFAEVLPTLLPTAHARGDKGSADEPAPGEAVGVWGEGDDVDSVAYESDGAVHRLRHGSVVIAAITSCTNTSNPSVMLAAGLLAKKAVERGIQRRPWVKTSLAPGSKVVTEYYEKSGLNRYLDELGFQTVGYGCTTCIGNSGPLPQEVSDAVTRGGLVVASVLSGNRNFEGRIHSEVRANYLMSPPLVVAFALAGRIDIDLYNEPLGTDSEGRSVFLRDIWPSQEEIQTVLRDAIQPEMYQRSYGRVFEGDERWRSLEAPGGDRFQWDASSTYVQQPPYFVKMAREATTEVKPIRGARAIAVLGDSVTTDHISPAGNIKGSSPAGKYLIEHGVEPRAFNSYGSRRGNHEVMIRGTFANVRIRNLLIPGVEGGFTRHLPSDEIMTIFDAAMRYEQDGTPLVVLAGKEYGSGSSRDWAAKGPHLQGIRAVIAESYERIHRSNLIGMGVLPLQFRSGDSIESLQLDGTEVFDVEGLEETVSTGFATGRKIKVRAKRADGSSVEIPVFVRIDTPQELLYYLHGGILQYVLRQLLLGRDKAEVVSASMAATAQASPEHTPHDDQVHEGSVESFPASDAPAY